jgi:putative SOS response-associated peptidase YedK
MSATLSTHVVRELVAIAPQPTQEMIVACLWSHCQERDESRLSFAAVTDDPPAEIAAAGHDRCIIRSRPRTWMHGCIPRCRT